MPITPSTSVMTAPRRSTVRTTARRRTTASRSTPTINDESPSALTAQESHRLLRLAATCPGPRVDAVVDGLAALAQLERTERVDHDGQFLEPLRAQRGLDRRRLRTVCVPTGMQRD